MRPDSSRCANVCMHTLDELDDAILIVNQDDAIVESNKAACELYGYSDQELRRMHLKELVAPNVSLLSLSSSPFSCKNPTTWHCNKEGVPFFVELLERPLKSLTQKNLSLVKVKNISLAHLKDQQRQRGYQIYKAVVESGPMMIARLLPDTTITFANDVFCSYFGHSRTDLIGNKLIDFPPDPETVDFLKDYFANYVLKPQTITHDNIVINAQGRKRWVQFTESPIFNSLGNLHEIQIVALDIHEQKLAEILIQQKEKKYKAIMDQSNEGVALIELSSAILLDANQKFCDMLEYRQEDLLNLPVFGLSTSPPESHEKEIQEILLTGHLPLASIILKSSTGKLLEFERLAKLLKFENNDVALVSLRDVSERNRVNVLLAKQTEELQQRIDQLQKAWSQTIDVLAAASEAKDPYTAGHQKRVAQLAVAIARELKLPEQQITALRMAALIHDVGKITIPAELLSKPGVLSMLEYKLVQTHVTAGYELLRNLELPWNIADVVHQHHERINGSGYPKQLTSDQIHFKSKILGVADVVEAMSSHRPYRPALGTEVALREIEKGKGSQFDPEVVDACIKLFREKDFSFDDVHQSAPTWDISNRTFKESSHSP